MRLSVFLGVTELDGGDEVVEQELDRLDSVVVGWDDVIDIGRVDVGVDNGEDWNIQGLGFLDSVLVLASVGDDDGGWLLGHVFNAAIALVQEVDFLLETLDFKLGVAGLRVRQKPYDVPRSFRFS